MGNTFFPFILIEAATGRRIRIVVYAFVVSSLLVGMFIGQEKGFWEGEGWHRGVITYQFNFGREEPYIVHGSVHGLA